MELVGMQVKGQCQIVNHGNQQVKVVRTGAATKSSRSALGFSILKGTIKWHANDIDWFLLQARPFLQQLKQPDRLESSVRITAFWFLVLARL